MARGRPKKKGKRVNGRLSQAKEEVAKRREDAERVAYEEGPMQTVLQARRKLVRGFTEPTEPEKWRERHARPVGKDEARKLQLAHQGSVLDRLWTQGRITDQERAAGLDYCQRYITYARSNGLPNPTPKCASLDAIGGKSLRAENLRKAAAAKEQHMTDQRILRRCSSAGVMWAMKRACVTDDAAPPHLVKEGLSALVANNR